MSTGNNDIKEQMELANFMHFLSELIVEMKGKVFHVFLKHDTKQCGTVTKAQWSQALFDTLNR